MTTSRARESSRIGRISTATVVRFLALVSSIAVGCDGGSSNSNSSPGSGDPPANPGVNVASTFFGGDLNDRVQGVSLMPDGRILIAGDTLSRFDLASPQSPWSQVPATSNHEWSNGAASSTATDAFVAILSADLQRIEQWAYIGGCDGDRAYYAQADARSIYVVGITQSVGVCSVGQFPADEVIGTSGPGNDFDVFIARFDLELDVRERVLVFAGSTLGEENARGSMTLVEDASGIATSVYLSGTTVSADFPVAALTTIVSTSQLDHALDGPSDAFLIKLDGALDPLWATFYGGNGIEFGGANVRYHSGLDAVFIGGLTSSDDLTLTALAHDSTLGGSSDGFVARFDALTGALQAATYLGGSESDGVGFNDDLELTPAGDVVVAGTTHSFDFPVTANAPQSSLNGAADLFVTILASSLEGEPLFSTMLGGADIEEASGLAVDDEGHVYLTGETRSDDFPIDAQRAFDATFTAAHGPHAGGYTDCFLIALDPASSNPRRTLKYSSFFGGDTSVATPSGDPNFPPHGSRGRTLVYDSADDSLVFCGQTTTNDFPITNHTLFDVFSGEEEGFVARHIP